MVCLLRCHGLIWNFMKHWPSCSEESLMWNLYEKNPKLVTAACCSSHVTLPHGWRFCKAKRNSHSDTLNLGLQERSTVCFHDKGQHRYSERKPELDFETYCFKQNSSWCEIYIHSKTGNGGQGVSSRWGKPQNNSYQWTTLERWFSVRNDSPTFSATRLLAIKFSCRWAWWK